MTDLLLIVGSALCSISILLAVISLLRTRAPRLAAITMVLGLIALFGASWLNPANVGADATFAAWKKLFAGEISLSTDEPPVVVTVPEENGAVPANPEAPVDPSRSGETNANEQGL